MDDLLYDPFIQHPFTYTNKGDWALACESANYRRKASAWELADLLLWGIDHYCATRDEVASLYDEMAEQLEGIGRKTLMNYVSCARTFTPDLRHPGLEIGHHIACLGLDVDEAQHWLARAFAEGWSVAWLRKELHVPDPEELPVTWRDVERALTHNGVGCALRSKRGELRLPSAVTVVVESDSTLKWSVIP